MKVTVLYENTPGADPALHSGHGLSLFLETREHTLLFDFGRDAGFMENAARLGVDLGRAEVAILSHGHNDHGGGLKAFQAQYPNTRVYVRPTAFLPHISCRNGNTVDITVPEPLVPVIGTHPLHPVNENLLLFSLENEAAPDATLLETVENQTSPDLFIHEQHLIVKDGDRYHLVTGCAHAGIENIIRSAERMIHRPLSSVIGGLHYYTNPTAERLTKAAESFTQHDTQVVTGHCTGDAAMDFLTEAGVQLHPMQVGKTFEV